MTKQTLEKFPSKEAAIQRACDAMNLANFHDAFITAGEPPKPLLDKHELRRECERRRDGAEALKAIADYVQRHSSLIVRAGAKLWTPEQAAEQPAHRRGCGKDRRAG